MCCECGAEPVIFGFKPNAVLYFFLLFAPTPNNVINRLRYWGFFEVFH